MNKEIFKAYQDEKVEHLVDLTAYCATFLFVLHIEQQRHFADQISVLAVHETLKYSDLLASASPFNLFKASGTVLMVPNTCWAWSHPCRISKHKLFFPKQQAFSHLHRLRKI